jgi:hypothetical protein
MEPTTSEDHQIRINVAQFGMLPGGQTEHHLWLDRAPGSWN